MKAATIALIVRPSQDKTPELVEILLDDHEIGLLESGVEAGEPDPLRQVYAYRTNQAKEDNEFADYVEDLLSQPFLKPEIQEHGVQWLRSKIRIEEYQRNEAEAAKTIAQYALKVYSGDPTCTDFLLAGPKTQVRIRVFPADLNWSAEAA